MNRTTEGGEDYNNKKLKLYINFLFSFVTFLKLLHPRRFINFFFCPNVMGLIQKLGKITKSVIARYTLAGLIGFGAMPQVIYASEKETPTNYEQQIEVSETEQNNSSDNPGHDKEVRKITEDRGYWVEVVGKTKRMSSTSGSVVDKDPVLQSTVGIDMGNYSFDVWNNYSTAKGKIDEVDIGATWTPKVLQNDYVNTTLNGGLFFILEPKDCPLIGQVKATFSPKAKLPVDVSASLRQLFGEGNDYEYGNSLQVRVGKSFDLGDKLSASLNVDGYLNNKYLSEKKGLSHVTGTASINYNLTKNINLSSSVSYQEPIGNFRESLENELYGSVGVNAKF